MVHTLRNVHSAVLAVQALEDIVCHKTNLVKESNTFAIIEIGSTPLTLPFLSTSTAWSGTYLTLLSKPVAGELQGG